MKKYLEVMKYLFLGVGTGLLLTFLAAAPWAGLFLLVWFIIYEGPVVLGVLALIVGIALFGYLLTIFAS